MSALPHTEVLSREWLAPIALGRVGDVGETVRRLDAPTPRAPPPWVVAVAGDPGSGTSCVARRAARETADRLRGSGPAGLPRLVQVRCGTLAGTHGVATAMLQRFDEGFEGRGFPTAEILAGFLRRLRREERPTVLLLDDVKVGGPDLAPVLRAIGAPDRFLPEGETGLPPIWTLLAGQVPVLSSLADRVGDGIAMRPFVVLPPLSKADLEEAVRDRAERALGHAPRPEMTRRVVGRALEDGGGIARAIDLLRRELLGLPSDRRRDPSYGHPGLSIPIEPRVVSAIGAATRGASAGLSEIRRVEADFARRQGVRPLPTTTLWRRLVRLERAGYVRREIRAGGTGGTRSVLRLLTPIDEWVTAPARPETRPAGEPSLSEGAAARGPSGPA